MMESTMSIGRFSWMGRAVCAAVVGVSLVSAASGVTIETVRVGDVGNAADTTTGRGAVDYEYDIGKYEVTAGQYTEFLNAVAKTDTYGLWRFQMQQTVNPQACNILRTGGPGSRSYSVAPEFANRPVNFVGWGDAARFANWLHNGQPTTGVQDLSTTEDGAYYLNGATTDAELMAVSREADWKWAIASPDEWYKAAYYDADSDSYNRFATSSSNALPGYVNDSGNLSGSGDPFVDGVTDPGHYATFNDDGGTAGIGSPHWRTEVGEWENSASPYGTFDQNGNVLEWNESVNSKGDQRGSDGGDYSQGPYRMWSDHFGSHNPPTRENAAIGFRVVQVVPEPGS